MEMGLFLNFYFITLDLSLWCQYLFSSTDAKILLIGQHV